MPFVIETITSEFRLEDAHRGKIPFDIVASLRKEILPSVSVEVVDSRAAIVSNTTVVTVCDEISSNVAPNWILKFLDLPVLVHRENQRRYIIIYGRDFDNQEGAIVADNLWMWSVAGGYWIGILAPEFLVPPEQIVARILPLFRRQGFTLDGCTRRK